MRKGVGSHGLRGLRGAAIPPPVHGERRRRVGAADRYRGVHPADSHARRRPACSPSGHLAEQWPTHACARSGEVHVAERGGGTSRHSAALRGTPRHFAALRGTSRHSAALRGTPRHSAAPSSSSQPRHRATPRHPAIRAWVTRNVQTCPILRGSRARRPPHRTHGEAPERAQAASAGPGSDIAFRRCKVCRIRGPDRGRAGGQTPAQQKQDQRTGPGSGGRPDTGPTEAGPRAH